MGYIGRRYSVFVDAFDGSKVKKPKLFETFNRKSLSYFYKSSLHYLLEMKKARKELDKSIKNVFGDDTSFNCSYEDRLTIYARKVERELQLFLNEGCIWECNEWKLSIRTVS